MQRTGHDTSRTYRTAKLAELGHPVVQRNPPTPAATVNKTAAAVAAAPPTRGFYRCVYPDGVGIRVQPGESAQRAGSGGGGRME